MELVNKENPKAMYNYCNRWIGCHYKRNDTSPMMTHLIFNCLKSTLKKSKLSKNQTLLQMSLKKIVEGTSSNQMGFMKYDSNNVRNLVVQYFIKSELLFRHVESDGFRKLMNGI
jgi:glycogen debranching enzyme